MHPALKTYRLYNASPVQEIDGHEWILCSGMGYSDGHGGIITPWADATRQAVTRDGTKAFAQSITARVCVLDIEHLKDDALGLLVDILETIRFYRPDVAIGVWSLLPSSEFWIVQNYAQYIDAKAGNPHIAGAAYTKAQAARIVVPFENWQARNRLIAKKLLPHVDALFPSIYPAVDVSNAFATNDAGWKLARNAEIQIDEAIAVAGGKPVFPFYYPYIKATKQVASEALTRAIVKATHKANGFVTWADTNLSAAAIQNQSRVIAQTAVEMITAVATPVET